MKITIEIPDESHWQTDIKLFRTKEEWDADSLSYAGWQRRCKLSWSGGANYRYYNEPVRFPCLMIEAGSMYNPDGPDHEMNAFIYDFKIEE